MSKPAWLKLSSDSDHPRRYRKEIFPIEEGWEKNGMKLPFNQEFADTVVSETTRKLANGVKSPLVLTHDGQEPFGQVARIEEDDNDRGGRSLFAVVDFENAEAEEKGKANDVSVYIPPKSMDGKGVSYTRPLEHLALTPYPVVHGMDDWQPLVASFGTPTEENTMDLKALATALGVTLKEDDDEAANMAQLVAAVKALKGSAEKVEEKVEEVEASLKVTKEALRLSKEKSGPEPMKVPTIMLSNMVNARTVQLDALVEKGVVDAATRDKMAAKYCGKEYLTLALSKDIEDDFEFTTAMLQGNSPLKATGTEAADEAFRLALHGGDDKDGSSVVDAMKELAKA